LKLSSTVRVQLVQEVELALFLAAQELAGQFSLEQAFLLI
jgi:hypothetical protein